MGVRSANFSIDPFDDRSKDVGETNAGPKDVEMTGQRNRLQVTSSD